jgi:hypothetical protein
MSCLTLATDGNGSDGAWPEANIPDSSMPMQIDLKGVYSRRSS